MVAQVTPSDNVHQMQRSTPGGAGVAAGSDNGQIRDDMNERLAKLEGAFDGLKMAVDGLRHGQNMIVGLLSVGFAVVIFFMGYLLTRIDNLPTEFERLNQTLSSAITAAQGRPPQIIIVPSPATIGPLKNDEVKAPIQSPPNNPK